MVKVISFIVAMYSVVVLAKELPSINIVTEHLPPFQMEHNGKVSGIAVDIVSAVNAHLNIVAPIKVYPWTRAYNKALTEPNTLIFSLTRNNERESLFEFVGELPIHIELDIWTYNKQQFVAKHWQESKYYKTAIPRTDSNYEMLISHGYVPGDNLFVTNSFSQAIEMLVSGRIDFIIAGNIPFEYFIAENGYEIDRFYSKEVEGFENLPLGFAFSRDSDPLVIDKYKEAFQILKEKKIISGIIQEWMH